MGYQKQEFDEDSGELVNADADDLEDDLALALDDEAEYVESFDE